MGWLVTIYAAIFSVTAVQGIREDLRFGAPLWKAALSTIAKALGVAGMLLSGSDYLADDLRSGWRWVVGLILLEALVELRFSYVQRFQRVLPDGESGDAQLRSLIWTSVLLGLVAAAPYYWLNIALAFGARGG